MLINMKLLYESAILNEYVKISHLHMQKIISKY